MCLQAAYCEIHKLKFIYGWDDDNLTMAFFHYLIPGSSKVKRAQL